MRRTKILVLALTVMPLQACEDVNLDEAEEGLEELYQLAEESLNEAMDFVEDLIGGAGDGSEEEPENGGEEGEPEQL